jgi:hypothetical protein
MINLSQDSKHNSQPEQEGRSGEEDEG